MQEMQELRATAEKAQKEAEVRERQFKKCKLKLTNSRSSTKI